MIISIISIIISISSIFITLRNNKVLNFMLDLTDQVIKAAERDIMSGRDYRWRYHALDSVSYWKVLFSFKKLKVENYWPHSGWLE